MSQSSVRARLYERLRERSSPVLVLDEQIISAASLWVASRTWLHAFRSLGLRSGMAVGFEMSWCSATAAAFVAASWDDLAFVLPPLPADVVAGARCGLLGTFEVDADRITPVVRGVHGPFATRAPGLYVRSQHRTWPSVWSAQSRATSSTVVIETTGRATFEDLEALGAALLSAEVIRLTVNPSKPEGEDAGA